MTFYGNFRLVIWFPRCYEEHSSTSLSYKYGYHHQSSSKSCSYTPRKKRYKCETRPITTNNEHHSHQTSNGRFSNFYHRVSLTHLSKDHVSAKTNLDRYNGLINSRKHMQNFRTILELVTQKSDAMCKISPTIFHGFAQVWYHNLEPDSIFSLHDLYAKLISCFNTSIPTK
ncbi:hypothetical protein NC653_019320 [Populus alba x Populus x berolinensis]|uniref:Uncharacterized protein n=1 Tax=Populus alba x Populus x berolinensis TaxID=444605 RepID=A0AAD6VX78_9ROSI|nr:hypothetical protein NC653_019320 [Populus alba x Populus x berolinensis]